MSVVEQRQEEEENPLTAGLERLPIRPTTMTIFGGTGDLARRKLLPALYNLAHEGALPERFNLIGVARRPMSDDEFRAEARESIQRFSRRPADATVLDGLLGRLHYVGFSFDDLEGYGRLRTAIEGFDSDGGKLNRAFYMSTAPEFFPVITKALKEADLNYDPDVDVRAIIEKPFGTDLESSKKLNDTVHAVFDESQVFRIDHFLGKESVDNILAFRFANGLYEPIWNRQHIRYVEIDVPETLTIKGRGAFYDATGAYRDMVVTHLFQVLAFVAMEPPVSLSAKHLRDEKEKVFEAVRPIDVRHVVRGQYEGYRSEPGVAADSQTETMVAVRAEVDNWRWHGVPFFLRSGKAMGVSRQIIVLGFQPPPMRMFPAHRKDTPYGRQNEIVIDFADPGAIKVYFLTKVPGAELTLGNAEMAFYYKDSFAASHMLEGYEHLTLMAMVGDPSLFTRSDGIERLWEISTPLLDNPPPVEPYPVGSYGPESMKRLIAPYHWHLPHV